AVVHGLDAGRALVTRPAVAAVAFTGSAAAGRALFDLTCGRPDPIPFYGELGSLNPTVVTPGAVAARGPRIASGFVASFTLGAGQFCTKPGLLFLPAGHGLEPVLAEQVAGVRVGPLLYARLRDAYAQTLARLTAVPGVRTLTGGPPPDGAGHRAPVRLLGVSAADLSAHADELLRECFGPAALVVEYADVAELEATLARLPGSLTTTVHAEPDSELELARRLVEVLGRRAGRLIWNGWPTGVAVTWAMHHGGPWPATTASIHTSVGATAVRRFLRPVAYQDVPDALLPEVLRDGNPLRLPRRVDGGPPTT